MQPTRAEIFRPTELKDLDCSLILTLQVASQEVTVYLSLKSKPRHVLSRRNDPYFRVEMISPPLFPSL